MLAVLTFGSLEVKASAATYSFTTLDDKNADSDVNFNQLLGINDQGIIVGYDGDGTVLPNKGYLFVPFDHYADENYPGSAQTQVTGISNNPLTPYTVGFWVDANGNNFGFTNIDGQYVSVSNPHTGTVGGVTTNQLLGVNTSGEAVGFYIDPHGNPRGYTYTIATKAFGGLSLPFADVTGFQTTGLNDAGVLCGFYTTKSGGTFGFYGKPGSFVSVEIPHYAATTFLGINNKGIAAGFVTNSAGTNYGLVYDTAKMTSTLVKDPMSSSKPAFGVTGTLVNGLNDAGDLVGFYSDGKQVHGFLAVP